MTDTHQKQLGNTLWSIADQLRGAMDADDFRDYRHIHKIIETYKHRSERSEETRYSRRVGMEEIAKNDDNLNISRYISTAEPEEEIDLGAVHAELTRIDAEIQAATDAHNAFLKELGLPLLP